MLAGTHSSGRWQFWISLALFPSHVIPSPLPVSAARGPAEEMVPRDVSSRVAGTGSSLLRPCPLTPGEKGRADAADFLLGPLAREEGAPCPPAGLEGSCREEDKG